MCVSIIVPTYNGSRFLRQTVQAAIVQTFRDWELIIVDDGSIDYTQAIARELCDVDPRIQLVASRNEGEASARNLGFQTSDSERPFVIFLDHDDIWIPTCLSVLVSGMMRFPEAVGVHGVATMIDSQGHRIRDDFLENWCRLRKTFRGRRFVDCGPSDTTQFASLVFHVAIATMGLCLLRRAAMPRVPFRATMKSGSADLHLYLTLARKGDFAFIDDIVIEKRLHESNLSNDQLAIDKSVIEAVIDIWLSDETSEAQRSQLQYAFAKRNKRAARFELGRAKASAKSCRPRDMANSIWRAYRLMFGQSIRSMAYLQRSGRL